MKKVSQLLKFGTVSLPVSPDGLLYAPAALLSLGLTVEGWTALVAEHGLDNLQRDFGAGPESTLSTQEFAQLVMSLPTPEARRWRKRAADLLSGALSGDVKLAAQVAERAPDPAARRWLAARLESTDARRELMAAVARCGGHGEVYGQLGSISNRSVLGKSSTELRQERGVKHTRDGLSSTELLRMAYLDSSTARALDQGGIHGNAAIVRLHQAAAQRERQSWEGAAQVG